VAPQGIGKPVRRREDSRFLTGAGNYADDMSLPSQAYAYMVRSPASMPGRFGTTIRAARGDGGERL
jgi:carbon-monoxide dehydrogenase large subunit